MYDAYVAYESFSHGNYRINYASKYYFGLPAFDYHHPSESWRNLSFWLGRESDEVISWVDGRVKAITN